jgi:hypothetical protein
MPTSHKIHLLSITNTNWLMLHREIIVVYSESHK